MTPPLHTCVQNGELVCCDDLCHGSDQTICGLWHGIDFGVDDAEDYDDWHDEPLVNRDGEAVTE